MNQTRAQEMKQSDVIGIGGAAQSAVALWLNGLRPTFCSEYLHLFVESRFDNMEIVATMTDFDLRSIGISKLGHRRQMLMELDKMSKFPRVLRVTGARHKFHNDGIYVYGGDGNTTFTGRHWGRHKWKKGGPYLSNGKPVFLQENNQGHIIQWENGPYGRSEVSSKIVGPHWKLCYDMWWFHAVPGSGNVPPSTGWAFYDDCDAGKPEEVPNMKIEVVSWTRGS